MEKWTKCWPLGNPPLNTSDIGLGAIGTVAALAGGYNHQLSIMVVMGLVLLALLVGRVWAWGWYEEA